MTCGEMAEYLKTAYDFIVGSIYIDSVMIYDNTFSPFKDNVNAKIEDSYEQFSQKKINDKTKYFFITIIGNVPEAKIDDKGYKDVGVLLPKIKYIFK